MAERKLVDITPDDSARRFDTAKVISLTRTVYPDDPNVRYEIRFPRGEEVPFLNAVRRVLEANEYEKLVGMMRKKGLIE